MARGTSYQEIYDFDGHIKVLADLENAYSRYSATVLKENARLTKDQQAIIKNLQDLKAAISAANNAKLGPLADDTGKVEDKLKAAKKAAADLNTTLEVSAAAVDVLKVRQSALTAEYNRQNPATAAGRQRMQELKTEMGLTSAAANTLTQDFNKNRREINLNAGTYRALQKETTQLKNQIKDLPGAFDAATGAVNRHNREAVKLQTQIEKNERALLAADKQLGNSQRNVGNYASALSKIGLAGGPVAAVIGAITTAVGTSGQIIDTTLKFDSLDSSLAVVSGSTAVYNQRQEFLKKTSADLGQQLDVLQKSYVNITASSKGTTLEGKATDDIFKAIVGTMARLKKPAEDTDRALLAIGQSISKGTVQSEELRGQLGDVLPGSFGIFAKALGVTTAKLGEMLKAGEVLSADALPKFAAELERTFNPDHAQRVDGLAAALARAKNEGFAFVKSLNLADKLSSIVEFFTKTGQSIRESFSEPTEKSTRLLGEQTDKVNGLEAALPGLLTRYDELKNKTNLTTAEQTELQGVINQITTLAPSAATGFDAYGNALDVNKGKVLSFTLAQRQLNAELNKQVIADLNRQAATRKADADRFQGFLNANNGQRINSADPNSPVVSAPTQGPGRKPLSDQELATARSEATKASQDVLTSYKQIIAAGGQLTDAQRQFVAQSGDLSAKQLVIIDDYNRKIATKTAQAADLFQKQAFKEREGVVKEVAKLQNELNQIINPTLPTPKSTAVDVVKKDKTKKELTDLQKLEKQIGDIKAQIQADVLEDVRAGRDASIPPKLTQLLTNLEAQVKAVNETIQKVEQGYYSISQKDFTAGKRVVDLSQAQTITSAPELKSGLTDKRGKELTPGAVDKQETKRTADYQKELDRRVDILNAYQLERSQLEHEFDTDLRGLSEKTQNQLLGLLDEERAARERNDKAELTSIEKRRNAAIKAAQDEARARQQFAQVIQDIGTTLVTGAFDQARTTTDNELSELDKRRQAELDAAGENAVAKSAINKRFDAEQMALKRKQARQDKLAALFNIALSTAQAVMKTYAEFGFPVGIPLAIAQGALGLIQAGLVAAKPLPAYKDGVQSAPAGPALVGEAGAELRRSNGKFTLYSSPTVASLEQGDTVFTAAQTRQIYGRLYGISPLERGIITASLRPASAPVTFQGPSAEAIGRAVAQASDGRPVQENNWDDRGYRRSLRKGNQRTESFNAWHTL